MKHKESNLKLLFINCTAKSDFSCSMPLSIGYLAGYLKNKMKHGISVKAVSKINLEEAMEVVKNYKPDLVGLSLTTPSHPYAKKIANLIKKFDSKIKIVVGGPHVTLFPNQLTRDMDFGVMAEGEETFYELITKLYPSFAIETSKRNKKFSDTDGLIFWENGKLKINKSREFIKNLDDVGHPERGLLNPTNNTIFASRGCPYNCVFCSSVVIWKRNFRMHSAQYIFEEIKRLYELKHSVQWFSDDLFACNKQLIRDLIAIMKKEKLLKKISFFVLGRSNLFDDEMARLLKELNVVSVSFGFESGDEKIIKYAKGGVISVKDHINASNSCRKHGMLVDGYLMIGFPDETGKDVMRTYEFSKKYCDLMGDPNLVIVYPRTGLNEELKKETGKDYSKIHLERLIRYGKVPVEDETVVCKNLTAKQITNYKKMFVKLSKKKARIYYFKLWLKLIFSRSFFLNIYYFYNIFMTKLKNPKREFISKTIHY